MQNRLSAQSSPYLKQHAQNPVAWQPWDETALLAAKTQKKPILLSIGYSTCHWCHVMAHESFEDEAVAAVMNEHFVNIKVDREERPDLDKIYQTALQLLTQQGGGWPLTMFLDPETLVPFYGGTYFPKTPRYQLPGFVDLLLRLKELFAEQHDQLTEQGTRVKLALDQMVPPVIDAQMKDTELLRLARDQLAQQYDHAEGGFGSAPKFPMPTILERLLRYWSHARRKGVGDKDTLDMVMITLTQMARGGIYDHLGGGFCRYATDRKWMIPHFEKMLYDNGQLLSLYSAALALGPDELFAGAVRDTVGWLLREMRHPGGGFFAALDADSEGEEGKFYVWRRDQVKKLLEPDEYLIVETLYGLDKPANFENKWNLHRHDSWRSVVQRLSLERETADAALASARVKLLAAREQRARPGTDEKILTAWNGLLIRGLADSAQRFGNADWLAVAQGCADFLRENCYREGVLYATWQSGKPLHPGYLDDYANLLLGLLSLLSAQWRACDIRFARQLADHLLTDFQDADDGGFFFTSHSAQATDQLIHRPKPTMDDALPPGNGTAALALLRLGHLLGDTRYLDAAHGTLRWARAIMERVPAGHCQLLTALEETVHPPQQVVLRGPAADMQPWVEAVNDTYAPWRSCFAIPYKDPGVLPAYLPKLMGTDQQQIVTAFVCSDLQCSLPMTSIEALQAALQ